MTSLLAASGSGFARVAGAPDVGVDDYWTQGGGQVPAPTKAHFYKSSYPGDVDFQRADESETRQMPAHLSYVQRFQWWLDETVSYNADDKARYGAVLFGRGKEVLIQTNLTGIHAAPIHLQEFFNAATKFGRKLSSNEYDHEKTAERVPYLHPLPKTASEKEQQMNVSAFAVSLYTMISFAFVSGFSLVFIVMEKEAEVKLHQFINGVSITTYWLSNVLWDHLMYWVPILSVTSCLLYFPIDMLVGEDSIYAFLALLICFSFAMPAFGYLFAHQFKSSEAALSVALVMNVGFGTLLFILGFILEIVPFEPTRKVSYYLGWGLKVWPVFALGEGLWRICMVAFTWQSMPPESRPEGYFEICREQFQ